MSGMKSAYELAMARFGGESVELSADQKAAIADVESRMKAKVAENEIMLNRQLAAERDPARAALLEQTIREQIVKIRADANAEKEQIRHG